MSAQKPVPSPSPASNLNLDNIQGDVIVGLPKKVEEYVFLQIKDTDRFREDLVKLVPLVTTSAQAIADKERIIKNKTEAEHRGESAPLLPLVGLTIGFSQTGLNKIGKHGDKGGEDDLGDDAFRGGMKADSINLGDPFNPEDEKDPRWLPTWKKGVDVMLDITGDSWAHIARRWYEIEEIFGIGTHHASVTVMIKIKGNVRPGKEKGHEHFGFADGISLPAIEGFDKPHPGQTTVPPRVILFGQEGSPQAPEWSKDGSFLAFRHLEQLVPEFDEFLRKNPIDLPGLDPKKGSELRGARFVGRWKSGAPIELAPTEDDPTLGADPERNNNFVFNSPEDPKGNDQTRCPFAAHVRKTNPRTDLDGFGDREKVLLRRLLLRRGIPFGPEVTPVENLEHRTRHSRGLAFAAYNASITEGFRFVQTSWANNKAFPPQKVNAQGQPVNAGFDPIVGQAGNDAREVVGTDINNQEASLKLPFDFVVPKGGEYFFIPSIAALRDEFASSVHIES